MSWFTISSLSGKRLCAVQHGQQASSWHTCLGCGQITKQDFISPNQTVIQLHQPLSVSVVGAFLLEGNYLIASRLRSRAGSAVGWWRQSAGPWPGEVSSGLSQAGESNCGAAAPSGQKQRANQASWGPRKEVLPLGLEGQQPWFAGWMCWITDNFPTKPALGYSGQTARPVVASLKILKDFFFCCFLCPSAEWKLAEISEKVQRMGNNFPPISSQQCCFPPQKNMCRREKTSQSTP